MLQTLRERLRCKEIWVEGANRYRNPDADVPQDLLRSVPHTISDSTSPWKWIRSLPSSKGRCIPPWSISINDGRHNPKVSQCLACQKRIKATPLDAHPEPARLRELKEQQLRRWPMTGLLDILKETDFRVGFTRVFDTTASRQTIHPLALQKRLLLCLYALGTNTGVSRVLTGDHGVHAMTNCAMSNGGFSSKNRSERPSPRSRTPSFVYGRSVSGGRSRPPVPRTRRNSGRGIRTYRRNGTSAMGAAG